MLRNDKHFTLEFELQTPIRMSLKEDLFYREI